MHQIKQYFDMNIIITGASRGIGYETSKQLAKNGHDVIATARSSEPLERLSSGSEHIAIVSSDLTDPDDISKFGAFVDKRFSRVDGLVNNAGALVNKPFEKLTMADWEKMISVNLYSAVRLVNELLPRFASPSHILNISSMGGYQGSDKFPGLTAYSVAKGGLSILAECLAAELGDRQIRCNALCLGAVQTEMLEQAFPGFEAPVTAREMGDYIADFVANGHRYYNGKILPVALDDPE